MNDVQYFQIVRSQAPEADSIVGGKKSQRSQWIAEGTLIPAFALGGRARAYFFGELAGRAAAIACGATKDDLRALVRRQMEKRKERFERLKAA